MTSQPRKACLCHWAHIPSLYWKFECSNLDGISSILCGCHSRFWQLYKGDSGNCPTCSTPQYPYQERGIFPLEPGLWCCLQKTQRSFPDQTSASHAIQHPAFPHYDKCLTYCIRESPHESWYQWGSSLCLLLTDFLSCREESWHLWQRTPSSNTCSIGMATMPCWNKPPSDSDHWSQKPSLLQTALKPL